MAFFGYMPGSRTAGPHNSSIFSFLKESPPYCSLGFPGGTMVKNTPTNARGPRDTGSIPGSGRSYGGNGNLL